ncbi:hypothetical protein AB0H36_27520 [Kribbella sp. NPDC050820]|uniref:hypothetical protein n=1 Tax=Kribbella sp. NPDC050820 TaxID=3155408 RepID=UPI0033EFAC4D
MDPAAGTIASSSRTAGLDTPRPSELVETTGADKVAYAFYAVAASAALVGQVWAGVKHIPWPSEGFPIPLRIALVAPAVGVIELGGVATAALADVRRRKGENAYAYRAMSLAAAIVALTFNVVGHWTPEERFLAFGFGGLSAFAYVLWIVHSGARRRDALRATGHMAQTAPVYGLVRWLRDPRLTYRARQLALEHGYGLFDSVRIARDAMRTERRNHAISQVVAETIAAQHKGKPLHAQIAVTAYDVPAVAAEISKVVDNPMMARHIARVLEPPAHELEPAPSAENDRQAELSGGPSARPDDTEILSGQADAAPDTPAPVNEAAELLAELRSVLAAFQGGPGQGFPGVPTDQPDTSADSGLLSGRTDDQPNGPEDPEPPETPGPGAPKGSQGGSASASAAELPRPSGEPVSVGQGASGGHGHAGQAPSAPASSGRSPHPDPGLADTATASDTTVPRPDVASQPRAEHQEEPQDSATEPPSPPQGPEMPAEAPAAADATATVDSTVAAPGGSAAAPPGEEPATMAAAAGGQNSGGGGRPANYWDRAFPAMEAWADNGEEVTPPRLTAELDIPDRTARRLVKKWEEMQAKQRRRENRDNVFPLSGQR